MIAALDSAAVPNPTQIAAAKAAGYGAWLGYLASGPNEDILDPWPDSAFADVQAGGLLTGAYVSGLDDPAWLKDKAAALGILIFLDDENSVRRDGSWTDPFLTTSGAGIYGGSAVQTTHLTHGHPSYIFSGYPGGTQSANWPPGVASPPQPKGWQYLGTQATPWGITVDYSNLDPAVLAAPTPTKEDNVTGFIANYGGGLWIVYITENGLVKQPMLDGTLAGALNAQGFTDFTPSVAQMAAIPNVVYPPVGGAGAPFASTIAGTIEDQGGGKSSLSGTATPS